MQEQMGVRCQSRMVRLIQDLRRMLSKFECSLAVMGSFAFSLRSYRRAAQDDGSEEGKPQSDPLFQVVGALFLAARMKNEIPPGYLGYRKRMFRDGRRHFINSVATKCSPEKCKFG